MTDKNSPDETPAHRFSEITSIRAELSEIESPTNPIYEVFSDWLTVIINTRSGNLTTVQEILEPYSDDDAARFAEAYNQLQTVSAEVGHEVLGDVYASYALNSDEFAQHFTPVTVSDGMAGLLDQQDDSQSKPVRVLDPACGSGRLLISNAQRVKHGHYTGVDKDKKCALMTVVNFIIFGIDGIVVHGDSLTLDFWNAWQTHDGRVRELDPADVRERFVAALES
jgi:type I restriction-modification system DNA methylase subunit